MPKNDLAIDTASVESFIDLIELSDTEDRAKYPSDKFHFIHLIREKRLNRRRRKLVKKALGEMYCYVESECRHAEVSLKDYSSDMLRLLDEKLVTQKPYHYILAVILIVLTVIKMTMFQMESIRSGFPLEKVWILYSAFCFFDIQRYIALRSNMACAADLALKESYIITECVYEWYSRKKLKCHFYGNVFIDSVCIMLALVEFYVYVNM